MAVDAPAVLVRKAEPQDMAAVAELGVHTFTVTFGHSVSPSELETYLKEAYSVEAITRDANDPQKDLLVATSRRNSGVEESGIVARSSDADDDEVVVGFILLTRGTTEPCVEHLDRPVELQRIYVHPSYHGRRVGRMLSDRVDELARAQGFKHIWLGVWEENFASQAVYKKLGYAEVGTHKFNVGGNVQTDKILAKAL